MAIDSAVATSRRFRVKDVAAFKADIGTLSNINVVDAVGYDDVPEDSVYIYSADGFWPEDRTRQYKDQDPVSDDPADVLETVYLPELIAPHLVAGEIAILEQVSSEDMDVAYAIMMAVNAAGKIVVYDFDSLAKMAIDELSH